MSVEREIRYEEEFIVNSRGLKLFTCRWLPPAKEETKALIFICHGYAMECSITMNSSATRLVKAGFAVYGLDYEGHGKSDGLQGFVDNFDNIIDDCSDHFASICDKKENRNKMRYLLGESMGGAVALLVHRKLPDYWNGAILVAPMCKISEDIRPSPVMINILTTLTRFIPTWRIIPNQDIIDVAFKMPEIRQQIRENPYCYKGRPRLKTGFELLRVSLDLEQNLSEVSLPLLVLHGEEDRVTSKEVSKQLHDVASSSDKTFRLYPGMWHGLLYGETAENIEIVFSDIIRWLEKRYLFGNERLERQQKEVNEPIFEGKRILEH